MEMNYNFIIRNRPRKMGSQTTNSFYLIDRRMEPGSRHQKAAMLLDPWQHQIKKKKNYSLRYERKATSMPYSKA